MLAVVAAAALVAPAAGAQAPPAGDAARYCTPEGGPLGAASDLEHTVKLGEAPLPEGLRQRRVTVDGVGTRVVEGGPAGAEEAVVFVHGSPGSARDFDDLLAAGGAFARTVSFDFSGYGQSDHAAPGIQSTDGAAKYLGGVLDQLGVRRAVLVLHDFGGPWALPWAVKHPDRLLGAVVMNSGVLIDYTPHPYALIWAQPGSGEMQMASSTREAFTANLQAANPRGLPADFLDRMYDNYDRATRCAALRYYRSAIRFEYRDVPRQQAAALRRTPRPALVIWGEQDIFVPAKHAQDQREAFPDAQIHLLENSGHWPFVDNAKRTRELFEGFLRPELDVGTPHARKRNRRVRVPVRVEGVLPAQEVQARVAGRRAASRPRTVAGRQKLVIRLRRRLRPGRHKVIVTARGLPAREMTVRVRPARR